MTAAPSSTGRPSSRRRATIIPNRIERDSRWRCRAASKASSSGSTPRPRMCNSPSQSRSMPDATLLISTAVTSSRGNSGCPGARSSRTPARVSWSARARTRTPTAAAASTRAWGSRTPSERRLWVWRSTREGYLGTTGGPLIGRLPRFWKRTGPPLGSSAMSDLDDPLDAFHRDRPAGGRIDVDQTGVEHDRTRPYLEPRRQPVDEARNDRGRVEAYDAVDRPNHTHVRLEARFLRHDPLVGGWDVSVCADHGADPAVEVDAKGVLLARQLAMEVDDTHPRQRL